ncbi:MAG TPA: hypothetical protein VHF22_10360, partial [Planctomycetota bacterium]|nr:hypothetical protein [Planctomycetota bacterium]
VDCLVRAVAPPWPGAFATLDGAKTFIHEGEPCDLPGRPPAAPGTALRLDGKVYVSTRDRWFRVDKMVPAAQAKEIVK